MGEGAHFKGGKTFSEIIVLPCSESHPRFSPCMDHSFLLWFLKWLQRRNSFLHPKKEVMCSECEKKKNKVRVCFLSLTTTGNQAWLRNTYIRICK